LEAEKTLRYVNGHQITSNLTYCLCMARAYVANKKGKAAWVQNLLVCSSFSLFLVTVPTRKTYCQFTTVTQINCQ
jgi:hypothetical protein